MSDPGSIRVGDGERDDAVDRLREHAAAGRLSSEEFSERMGKALEARTRADLTVLFRDLPGDGIPGELLPAPDASAYPYLTYRPARAQEKTFWTQWWWVFVLVAVALAAMRGSFAPVVVIAIVGYLLIRPRMSAKNGPALPARRLTGDEQQEIGQLIRAERKIEAIKRYREITGADLRTAKDSVEMWERDLGLGR